MIEIKDRSTEEVLHTVDADTLCHANLQGANLKGADLTGIDLSDADLTEANLTNAFLMGSTMARANLTNANLTGAVMHGTNLRDATLLGAHLAYPFLLGADLSGARCGITYFVQCLSLHAAVGLEKILHIGPSVLDLLTLRSCVLLPDVFLQGVGCSQVEITTLRELYGTAFRYYSCFLSHAKDDGEFVAHLRTDLLANNVNCWHYGYDMRGGKYWRPQINEAIKLHDKLILVCSKTSVLRPNVVIEIIDAMERERESGIQKLFPIRLDDFILSEEMLKIADEKMHSVGWQENWVRYVRAHHIPDFSHWKDRDVYKRELDRLLRDLKNPAPR